MSKRAAIRERLLDKTPWCYYCSTGLTSETATIDHVIPKSKGGTDDSQNLVLACPECNERKAERDFLLFLLERRKAISMSKEG